MIGALEKISSNSESFSETMWKALRRKVPSWGKVWSFKRCQINGTVYHSESYKRVTARNNFTICFSGKNHARYGSVLNYVKIQETCQLATCSNTHCDCQLQCNYFALVRILVEQQNQLPNLKGTVVIGHICRVEETAKIIAVPMGWIKEKCMLVSISNSLFVCHLANRIEKD